MKHLLLMLDGSARAWLNQLAPSRIYSWADLARVLIRTFEGTCKRPAGLVELQHCVQKQNEPLRDFIQRWTTLYHMVENVTEHQAVCAFKAGVRYRDLYLKFGRTSDISMSKMMEIATRYANGEEEDRIRSGKHKTVADGDGGNTQKGFGEGQPSEKDNEQDEEDKEDSFPQVHATLLIFADVERKSRLKLVNREVNMTTPASPKFLKWSQTAITFDQSDHPAHVPTPGRQDLVVDPVVEGVRLRKVLMDGGSGLNIMYADTLKGMGIPMSKLSESSMQFHGVVPGRKAKSLGQIVLDVVFGSDKNFRKEKLTLEVVDFQSAYHAILGRPAYARFMARPCYVYLKLKMPGLKGVITITGNRQRAEECMQQRSRIVDQQMAVLELDEYKKTVDPADLMHSKKPASESAFQSAGETKKVSIHPTDATANPTNISTTLDPK
ncbi:hypothetical protein ZWY2020_025208 [Hordeum vulgare]|nr:hypothetical protein ZWY2020_025208 [Hordeum vulgare]